MRNIPSIAAALVLAALLAGGGARLTAQSPPVATQAAIEAEARQFRFDLERNFFASHEAEIADRAEVRRAADALTALAAGIDRPDELLAALEADDRLQRRFRRHDLYLFLRFAVDIRREADLAAADELRTSVRAARQALRRAVTALEPEWIAAATRSQPLLSGFAYMMASFGREAPHLLPSDRQSVVAALEPLLGAGDYPRIVNSLTFESLEVDGEALNAGRDRSRIDASPSPEIRRAGARLTLAGYARQRELFAHMLVHVVQGSNALARLRGHASAIDEAAFDAQVSAAGYQALLAEVARHGPAYRRWQERVANPMGSAARWTPSAAAALIVESARDLDPAYGREFADLLDRRNGRADLGGGDQRVPIMGTASVYPTGNSAIYMQSFQGTLLDLIVLAHEGGHAVQAELMEKAGVPMAYAAGPGYFTESFGRFQELLLLDRLHRTARDPQLRREMRDALAARLLSVFPSAEEASIELAIHRGVAEGRVRTADDLDAATAEAGAPYSLEYARVPERRGVWMLSEGYFMAPMQELNDAHASLLSVRYFQLYRRDPEAFRRAYLALLSGGYSDRPNELLLRHLGLDMMARGFAAETMSGLLRDVEALYR
jgi:oligoendopeptidase F